MRVDYWISSIPISMTDGSSGLYFYVPPSIVSISQFATISSGAVYEIQCNVFQCVILLIISVVLRSVSRSWTIVQNQYASTLPSHRVSLLHRIFVSNLVDYLPFPPPALVSHHWLC